MKFLTTLFAASSFLFSCQETHPDLSGTNPFETITFSVSSVQTSPASINLDTLTRLILPIRIKGFISINDRVTMSLTIGQTNVNGYHTEIYREIQVSKGIPDFDLKIDLPIEPFRLASPEFYFSASVSGQSPVYIQRGIIKIEGYGTATSKIDSIQFSPSGEVKIGSSFSMEIWCSDTVGSFNLKDVYVTGKRPDGTFQTPFFVPASTTPGRFFLKIDVPETAQTGDYAWNFYARNVAGAISKPVFKTYRVNPK